MNRSTHLAMLAAALVLAAMAGPADAGAQEAQPKVSVVAEGAVPVKAKSGEEGANLPLVVVNQGPGTVRVAEAKFEASSWTPPGSKSPLVRQAGVEVESVFPKMLRPGAARIRIRLTNLKQLTGEPVDGQVILYTETGTVLGAVAVSITPAPQPSFDWPELFFWVGVGLFVIFCAVAVGAVAAAKSRLNGSAPGPDWSADGWSGKLAAVGGLLAIVLGEITLPTVPREIGKDTLVQMNVIFVVLLAVGPFIFYAMRRRKPPTAWQNKVELSEMEKKGVWGVRGWLLLSYAITAVAVTGQIAALALLGCEITSGTGWHVLVIAIGVVLTGLTVRSFLVVTYWQANMDWDTIAQTPPDPRKAPLNAGHQPIQVRAVD
jgi:hypothetical protein